MTTFLFNRNIYESAICEAAPKAKERLWIATADIKDVYVDAIPAERSEGRAKRGDSRGVSRVLSGREMVPLLEVLDGMVKRGVEVRLIHAKEPGPNFREDFDRYPRLFTQMERVLCPRVHFKCIIVNLNSAVEDFGIAA